ncbi:MAG: hypothetical protein K0S74_307 [Chlamydiales bacterium]|jgi:hypothetical protein|nr:hypothetical protein [Chlamydiales bacterium]
MKTFNYNVDAHLWVSQNDFLPHLIQQLLKCRTWQEKSLVLDSYIDSQHLNVEKTLACSSLKILEQQPYRFILQTLAIINQENIVSYKSWDELKVIFDALLTVEDFYDSIGGILGYQTKMLELIESHYYKRSELQELSTIKYFQPPATDISNSDNLTTKQGIIWGLKHLDQIAEIYPVGGSGDRLDLRDPKTNDPLPVARLLFCGKSLLAGLVHDVQAKEYVYYKIFNKQVCIPIGLMTSTDKSNNEHILQICKENNWFNRPHEAFQIFKQPVVPVVSQEGQWITQSTGELYAKPNGHGAIWKTAQQAKVFEWFKNLGKSKMLIRQINNPVAGVDYGILAFTGIGCQMRKKFGFASCPRRVHASEGMNILIEKSHDLQYSYALTNVEYTEFTQKGIPDTPEHEESPYSLYPANTNILFADITAIEEQLTHTPIPGMMINMKEKVIVKSTEGLEHEVVAGRLESMMQNMADYFTYTSPSKILPGEVELDTFLTYNQRIKTISVTKRPYTEGKPLLETPEGCFYELMLNHYDLLKSYCGFFIPELGSEAEYIQNGPGFVFLFHPALGPLYSIIAQKIRNGSFTQRSELQLDISEIDIKNLSLDGSFIIKTENIMGSKNSEGVLNYNERTGKCCLHNVKVINKGIKKSSPLSSYWQNNPIREEHLYIYLQGDAEFEAHDVVFNGNLEIIVPAGHKLTVSSLNGELQYNLQKIASPTWFWNYSITDNLTIALKKLELSCLAKKP